MIRESSLWAPSTALTVGDGAVEELGFLGLSARNISLDSARAVNFEN